MEDNNQQLSHPVQHPHHAFFTSRFLKWVVAAIAELIVIILVFALGIKVGQREEHFSRQWVINYPRNFGGFSTSSLANMPPAKAFGLFGTVISKETDEDSIVIKNRDSVEKTVLIDDETAIEKGFNVIKSADIKINDSVIIIGEPNEQGQIDAKLIRVLN